VGLDWNDSNGKGKQKGDRGGGIYGLWHCFWRSDLERKWEKYVLFRILLRKKRLTVNRTAG